jgi:hypothetical protein
MIEKPERQGSHWPLIRVFFGGIAIGLIVGAGGAILLFLHLIAF